MSIDNQQNTYNLKLPFPKIYIDDLKGETRNATLEKGTVYGCIRSLAHAR